MKHETQRISTNQHVNEEEKVELYDPDKDLDLYYAVQEIKSLQLRVKALEGAMEKGTEILLMHAQAINIISAHLGKKEMKKNDKKIIR